MITIVEPKEYIDKLWGKQEKKKNETYRLMKYVLRVDIDGRVLLHNVVTGRLVILSQEEAEALDSLPISYKPVMKELVYEHYLVPEIYDEHQQVVNLRSILWKLEDLQSPKGITTYTILPTTACNARCYYCFEYNCKKATMSEQTANEVVEFIASNCIDKRRVFITWFGGEPTIASHRIDQICYGLESNNISYNSCIITNGYLFDEEMVKKAKELWHTQFVQICVDGTEESYNKVKAYVGVNDNPYQRVMRNIGLLIEKRITVGLRMNYDVDNYSEFYDLCDEAYKRFGRNKYLIVAPHAVIGEYKNHEGIINHGSDEWFTDMQIKLREKACEMGWLGYYKPLPYINIRQCGSCKDYTAVITPEGGIVKCPEQFGDDQIVGHVSTGVVNYELVNKWKEVADYQMCVDCVLFPSCTRLVNCSNKTFCHSWKNFINQYSQIIVNQYNSAYAGGSDNEISGTESGICTC